MKANNIFRYIIGAMLILIAPLLAMLFTNEVNWNWFDFAVMGILLLCIGLIFELVTTRANAKYRPIIAIVLVAAILLIWAELAVGIFGSPIARS